jgi:hypothetical protein
MRPGEEVAFRRHRILALIWKRSKINFLKISLLVTEAFGKGLEL